MVEQVQIGPYKLQDKLGYGGMAVVYHAIDTRDDKEIALKILLPQYYNDEAFMRRFSKEGLNAQRLNHPNIVQTYSAGQDDGFHYIAMQYIDGPTLEKYLIDRKPLSLLETVRILGPISAALDYAHSLGYIHRDLKLNNIMRSSAGRYLLTDFGVSKHLSTDLSMMTGMGQSIGTPSYMSPEQARGERVTDSKSDIYSLGVIAYRLLTGQVPFTAPDPFELTHKIIFYEPLDPRRFNPQIDETAAKALNRVLAKSPDERPTTCQAFVDSLSGLEQTASATGFKLFPATMFRTDRQSKPEKQKNRDLLKVNPRILNAKPQSRPEGNSHRNPPSEQPAAKPSVAKHSVVKSPVGKHPVVDHSAVKHTPAKYTDAKHTTAQSPNSRGSAQSKQTVPSQNGGTVSQQKQFAEKINAEHVHALRTEAYSEITRPGLMPNAPAIFDDAHDDARDDAHTNEGTQELTRPVTMNIGSSGAAGEEPVLQMKSTSAEPNLPYKFSPGEPLPGQPTRTRRKRKTTVLTRGVRPRSVYADFRDDESREEEMRAAVEFERIKQLSQSSDYYGTHDWFDSGHTAKPRTLLARMDDTITWLYRLIEPLVRRFRTGYNLD